MEEEKIANAAERFKQKYLDPLQARMDKNHEYIFKGGYEKDCKEKNVPVSEEKLASLRQSYEKNVLPLNESRTFYKVVMEFISYHDTVIDKILNIHTEWDKYIVDGGVFPAFLMEEQIDVLNNHYMLLNQIRESFC